MSDRRTVFEAGLAAIAPESRSVFAISQMAFLMGAMEVLNPPAAKIMGSLVRTWNERGHLRSLSREHIVEQLIEETGTLDDASSREENIVVQIAVCASNILDACSGSEISTESLQGIAYSVFDIVPYFGEDGDLYGDNSGVVAQIIEEQQQAAVMKLSGPKTLEATDLIANARMAGLRLKGVLAS